MASNRDEYLDELEGEDNFLRERIDKGELACAPRLEIARITVLERRDGTDLVWLRSRSSSPPLIPRNEGDW